MTALYVAREEARGRGGGALARRALCSQRQALEPESEGRRAKGLARSPLGLHFLCAKESGYRWLALAKSKDFY